MKEFTCNICKRAFRYANDLRRHHKMCNPSCIVTHVGLPWLQCNNIKHSAFKNTVYIRELCVVMCTVNSVHGC